MKEFKFKSSFANLQIKPIVSEEKDKLLSLASLEEIGKFLPNIDITKNVDLLPVAFNACVINRVNKNEDVIDTKTAVAVYKEFINKPINIEHNRQRIIGVILTAGFSAFGSDKPLSEEEVLTYTQPFNITLGGLVWKIVNPELADLIEESGDPTSENYLNISASWELGFSDYRIVELNYGDKNISTGRIITDTSEINEIKKDLKCNGGTGKIDGDKRIYRMPIDDVLPLGIGFTEKPAADVKGIAALKGVQDEENPVVKNKKEELKKNPSKPTKDDTEAKLEGVHDFYFGVCPNCSLKTSQYSMQGETGYMKCDNCGTESPAKAWKLKSCVEKVVQAGIEKPQHFINFCDCGKLISSCRCNASDKEKNIIPNGCKECSEKQNNISQLQDSNVKIERKETMAIQSIKDITDESLASKQISASAVAEFLSSEIRKASETYHADKNALETEKNKVNDKLTASENKNKELENKIKEVESAVAQLNKEKGEREAVERFNSRMTKINEAFDLDDEVRATIAEELKTVASDEDFSKWEKKANVLLKGFAKKQTAKDKDKDAGKQDSDKKKADDDAKAAIDNAIDNAKKDTTSIANSASTSQPSMLEKYKNAFATENITVKL